MQTNFLNADCTVNQLSSPALARVPFLSIILPYFPSKASSSLHEAMIQPLKLEKGSTCRKCCHSPVCGCLSSFSSSLLISELGLGEQGQLFLFSHIHTLHKCPGPDSTFCQIVTFLTQLDDLLGEVSPSHSQGFYQVLFPHFCLSRSLMT